MAPAGHITFVDISVPPAYCSRNGSVLLSIDLTTISAINCFLKQLRHGFKAVVEPREAVASLL